MRINPDSIKLDTVIMKIPLDKLMLHRHPMRVIDCLTYCEYKLMASQTLVQPSSIFVDRGMVIPEFYVEMVAQTVAASNTFLSKKFVETISEGYIVGCSDFNVLKRVKIGSLLSIYAAPIKIIKPLSLFEGAVYCNSEIVAEGKVKFYIEE